MSADKSPMTILEHHLRSPVIQTRASMATFLGVIAVLLVWKGGIYPDRWTRSFFNTIRTKYQCSFLCTKDGSSGLQCALNAFFLEHLGEWISLEIALASALGVAGQYDVIILSRFVRLGRKFRPNVATKGPISYVGRSEMPSSPFRCIMRGSDTLVRGFRKDAGNFITQSGIRRWWRCDFGKLFRSQVMLRLDKPSPSSWIEHYRLLSMHVIDHYQCFWSVLRGTERVLEEKYWLRE